ncbi:MAG: hypothetical protein AAB316_08975 [Bacteroidota bacterium]
MKQSSIFSENKSKTLVYSPETKHLFSEEEQYFFEVIAKRMPTNSKYFRSQKRYVIEKTEELFAANPEMPPRQVIREVLDGMPDFLTTDNLRTVVGYITETWEQCQKAHAKKSPARELVTV